MSSESPVVFDDFCSYKTYPFAAFCTYWSVIVVVVSVGNASASLERRSDTVPLTPGNDVAVAATLTEAVALEVDVGSGHGADCVNVVETVPLYANESPLAIGCGGNAIVLRGAVTEYGVLPTQPYGFGVLVASGRAPVLLWSETLDGFVVESVI